MINEQMWKIFKASGNIEAFMYVKTYNEFNQQQNNYKSQEITQLDETKFVNESQ
ncbi:hypothetical protein RH915_00665 [Serpentinicella sp. ANB-PHB4]|uniref:hypothetical protein n=1 Tax=Serpentinicella sp. ANB-PHB4 TaxID=3074076 RepID=UPI00285756E9|nr:hypothetical protein [Serpentinicella sp. ANB-PHB4]MDR5657990.1 hypothetical protein [Serpentinicella sp. ANB-PHB4]